VIRLAAGIQHPVKKLAKSPFTLIGLILREIVKRDSPGLGMSIGRGRARTDFLEVFAQLQPPPSAKLNCP
jgi:hypothetical protein